MGRLLRARAAPGAALKKVADHRRAADRSVAQARRTEPRRHLGRRTTSSSPHPARRRPGLLRVPAAGGHLRWYSTRPESRARRGRSPLAAVPARRPGRCSSRLPPRRAGFDAAQVAVLDLAIRDVADGDCRGAARRTTCRPGISSTSPVARCGRWRSISQRLQPVGAARVVVPQVVQRSPTGVAEFDVARRRHARRMWQLAARSATPRTLVWVDRQGREQPIAGAAAAIRQRRASRPMALASPSKSRDRTTISGSGICGARRSRASPATRDRDESPVWTRDGRRLAFTSETGGVMGTIFWRPADGSGQPEQLGDGSRIQRASSVTPDGRQLLLSDATGLTTITLDGSRELRPLAALARGGGDGVVSPEWPVAGLRRARTAARQVCSSAGSPRRQAGPDAGDAGRAVHSHAGRRTAASCSTWGSTAR